MIFNLKNEDGYVYAYIEWQVVNEKGLVDDVGKYVHIVNMWVHPDHRNNGCITNFTELIFQHNLTRQCEFVYYNRSKYNGRKSPVFPIYKFLKKTRYRGVL